MFENMGHTGCVRWVGFEANTEYIVLIISCDMQVLRPCFIMFKMDSG